MDLQAAFRARLLAAAPVVAITTKIAWGELPQATPLPYIRLTKVGAGREWDHDGPDPLVNPRVQIDYFGATDSQVAALAAAGQAEMERLDTVTVGGWRFDAPAFLENDLWPQPQDVAGGVKAYLVTHDYRFWAQPA